MAFIHEIQIKSTGFKGAPGFTNLYFQSPADSDGVNQFVAAKAFLDAIAGAFPSGWSGQIAAVGRILEESTGTLARFTTTPVGPAAAVPGSAGGGYGAGVAGLVIGWSTLTLNRARLVRGRTFLVPLAAEMYESDGTITSFGLLKAGNPAQALIDANVGFCVWSRPRLGVGGLSAPVTSMRVNDQAAFLSSRRS